MIAINHKIQDELGKYKKTLMKELAKKYPRLGNLNKKNDHFGTNYFKKKPTGCGQKKRNKFQGRFYCPFTNEDIYVRGSFKTREDAAAAAAVESNKAWKKFTREFGCYAHVVGESIQETAHKLKEQEQIENCIDVKMVVNDSEVKNLHTALQSKEIFGGKAKKLYKMNKNKHQYNFVPERQKYIILGNLNRNNDHFGTSYFKKEPTGCGHRQIPKKKLE
jgi:hypothetical protein